MSTVDPSRVDAVILVGGKGTRLRPLPLSAPKPMLPTAGTAGNRRTSRAVASNAPCAPRERNAVAIRCSLRCRAESPGSRSPG